MDEFIYKCPFCSSIVKSPDKKGHLYVHSKKLVYFCHRCGSSGFLGNGRDGDFVNYRDDGSKTFADLLFNKEVENPVECLYYIPCKYPYRDSERAYNYLVSRGIDEKLQKFYDIRIGDIYGDMFGRVIVPNIVHKNIYTDMFVGRTYIEQTKKYKNPPNSPKSRVVFNLHRIKRGEPIIITEGVFSAISAGKNAVAVYGKYVSDYQYKLIIDNNPSVIYVSLDPDALREAKLLCDRIIDETSIETRLIVLPDDKDPADLGYELFKKYLADSKPYSKLGAFFGVF